MKKFSLFLSAMLISMMSFAADATFVFNTEAGLTALGIELPVTDAGNGAFQTALDDAAVYTMDGVGVGMSVTHKADGSESGKTRIWKKANGALDLRTYKDGGSLTFTAPEGGTISKIVLDGGKINFTVDGVALTDNTWAGEAASVTLVVTATCNVNTITVTYEAAAVEDPAEKPVVTAAELEQINGEEEIYHFYLSQGVAVNKDPESPYYGYTYVTAATDGASDGGSDRADTQKRGIFVFDAELNSLNPDNVGFLPANAAPLMTDVSRQAMHRLAVNPVNNHVVFCYNVEGASAIWSMDPANLAGDAVNLIEGLAITKANAFCFDAEGTLYVMDNANTSDGGKIVKVVNGELVTIAQNAIWGVQDISLASDGRGGLWIAQNRWNIDTYAVLSHVNAAGEVDFAVTKDSPEEVKALFPQDANASYRGQCAYNVEKDVLAFGGNKVVALFHVTYDAAGVPSIARIGATPVIGGNIDGVDFYANGDLAVVSASAERFQKYAVTYTVEGGEEIEWIEMPLEISNLTTMEMPVEGVTYLQLTGRDDMNDADVMLFLNNYTGEEKAYEVNAESSFMTFGGMELTVMDGSITKSVDPELGDVYAGIVHASVEEEGVAMYVAFDLKMYALPAIEIVIEDVEITVNEESAIATFAATWEGSPLSVEVSGFEEVEFKEYPECWLSIGDDNVWVDAAAGPAAIIIEDGVASLEGEFTSFATGKTYEVMLSGKLPVEEPEVVEPTYTENKLNTYAFGLESKLTASALEVTYRLNNSNATSVNVLVYNGDEVVATVAGTTTIGKNTVEVATADLPAGVQLTWAVEVNGTSVAAPTQEEKIYSFYHPSGLDIDNNPENPTFGMLLINEGMHSVKDIDSGYVSSNFGAGIFAFNPALEPMPNGDKPGYNGGVEFTTGRADGAGTAYSPRRIRISEDGRIFVTSLNTDGNYLWEVNPANMNEWTSVFQGTLNENKELITADSAFIAAPNNGFDVKGAGENLQLAMYSVNLPGITGAAMSGFRLHEYNLGTATTWATAPSKAIVEGKYAINYTGTQVVYDNEGGVWIASYRGTANDANPGLVHINADGVEDAKLIWSNVRQAGIRFNNDFTKLVVAGNNGAAKKATIYAVSKDENGAPVLTEETVIDMASVGNNLNDFAFDYAGNLYACGNSAEKLIGWAMPYSGQVVTPAASKYAFKLAAPAEIVGTVKRAVQNGQEAIVLTHEADGTAHIYRVLNGVAYELSQEGVIARDPENAGDLLAISDIAVTDDGKLIATNYMQTQSGDDYVDAGLKRGETRIYIWNDLAGDPSILFTSKMSSNWFRSKQGITMAVKGTSDNMEIFMTGIHATKAWARVSSYRVIEGVYVEPDVNNNDYYHFYDVADAVALETTVGTQYELNASPLGAMNWILDAELINPVEIVEPETNNVEISTCVALTEDLGKKYNGATYVTVGEKVLMVAPFATPEGKLTGVEILDITGGLDAAQYVDQLFIDEAVEATAAATAVEVVEGDEATALLITLVADATIYSLEATLAKGDNWEVYEDAITNLVIDYDNLLLIGGPSDAFQIEVVLGLGEYDRNTDAYQLLPASTISVQGSEATFVDGYASVDGIEQSATAVVHCTWNGMAIEFHLTMTSAPMEATVVVVENAKVEIEKVLLFGDMYDYALKMTGVWTNEGIDYPVLVEVPVYYPEATEPSEIFSTVTVGGDGEDDPWLGFGEGTLTVTTVDDVVTATGIVENPAAGIAIDITISGKIIETDLENVTVTAKPVKMIQNGQLIIKNGDAEYNAAGAVLK